METSKGIKKSTADLNILVLAMVIYYDPGRGSEGGAERTPNRDPNVEDPDEKKPRVEEPDKGTMNEDDMPPNPNRADGAHNRNKDGTILPMEEPADEIHNATTPPPDTGQPISERVTGRRSDLDDSANFAPGQSSDAAGHTGRRNR